MGLSIADTTAGWGIIITMKIHLILFALLLVCVSKTVAQLDIEWQGQAIQGGLLVGKVQPGSTVWYRQQSIRVAENGTFLLGFGRDEQGPATIEIICPDGKTYQQQLDVGQREYAIQRIDGLPQNQVTPPAEVLARIRADSREVAAARARDDARLDFEAGFVWPAEGPITGVYGSQRVLNGEPRRPHFGV